MGQSLPPGDPAAARPGPGSLLLGLRTAYASHRSVHVRIAHGERHRGLVLREGRIVQGRSDVAGEHLSDVLARRGLIGEGELQGAVAVALADRRPLGAVLAERGLADRALLEEAVGCHVREILFASFDEPGGTSVFEEPGNIEEALPEGDFASPLSTGQILLDAARRLNEPAAVREALGDPDQKLVLATDPRLRAHPEPPPRQGPEAVRRLVLQAH